MSVTGCASRSSARALSVLFSAMQASETEHSADDSDAGDDPRQSRVPKPSLHLESDYAAGSGSGVPATPEKSFEEEEGQSDDSEHHAQPQKRRRFPTKRITTVPTQDSDSDGVVRDSLLGSPSSHKRSFKRPRLTWCPVKEWPLDEYEKELAYEEIKRILTQSLIDAGSKIFIRPCSNSIAGWRSKQVIYAFLCLLISETNDFFLVLCLELCVPRFRHHAQYLCLPIR